jgi:hypothetical protein
LRAGNSRNSEWFNANRLFNYVKSFSFPRLAGTSGEEEAVELTIKTFKEIGFNDQQIQKKTFEFSDFYSTTLIKLIMVIDLTFSLFILMFVYINLLFTIIISTIMVFVFLLIVKSLKHPEHPGFWGEYYGKTISASNVFVKLLAKNLPLIVVTGIWFFTILISISNIFLMFLNTHNKSSGALDNASGMAVVFELSKFFKENALNNFNIWFCQFSAEELGTMGSRIFVNEYEGEFIKGRIFHINLDMISCICESKNQVEYLKSYGVLPRKKIAPLLSKYLDKAATDENINIKGFHLSTGAHTDSVPFHLRGFDSVDIVTRMGGKYTHNKEDTPDKVDPEVLKEACLIVRSVILSLDKDYEVLCKNQELFCDDS